MSVFETINNLKSFRSATNELIPRKVMGKILEAGRQAPSPGNVQSVEFIIVEDEQKKQILSDATGDERFELAPTSVIILTDTERMARRVGQSAAADASSSEAACAVQNMRLTAREEDVSSCWITGFDEGKVSDSFSIPDGKDPKAVVGLCYASSEYDKPDRFGMNSVVFYDDYNSQIRSLFDKMEWKGLRKNKRAANKKRKGLIQKLREKTEKYL